MKKSISLLFAALMCASVLFAEDTRIYCKMTHGWWTTDGAAVGAYYWGGSNPVSWPGVRMTQVVGETGLWYIDIDIAKYPNIIFTRVNGSGNVSDWGAKTQDLTIPTDGKNLFIITTSTAAWAGDNKTCTGTWSTYVAPVETPTYYITGNDKLVGTDKAWLANAIELGKATVEAPASYTFTNLAANDTMRLKVTNGTWDFHYGYTALDMTHSSENILSDKNGNIVFVLAEQGNVTITFDSKNICLKGSFRASDPVENITAYYVNTTGWDKVFAYVFEGENNNAWPGVEMTKTADTKNGFDVYSYEFPETYTNIIFNMGEGGEGKQTVDLTIDPTKLYFYDGVWYASLSDIPNVTTAVENVTLNTNAPMYNVLGVQVNGDYRGVVIQNGRKFVVK